MSQLQKIIGISTGISLAFYLMILLTACTGNETKDQDNTTSRLNILWIVADDLGTDLGCYGNSLIHTPNLDKLAGQGVLYTNFYTVTAVCSPSRSTLITGMYPVSIETHQHRTRYKKQLPEGISPITYYFRKAGYFTSNGTYINKNKPGKKDYNFVADSIFDGTDWSQRKEGQPFFSQIQIHYPHRPFLHDTIYPIDEEKIKLPPYYPNTWLARKDWALYLETIQFLDQQVGKVMDRMVKEDLMDNTIVFFFGDQGRPMVRAKQFMYDGGIHTPLIIRWSGEKSKGTVCTDLVSNIDIPVATLELGGIKVPEHLQGINFLDTDISKRKFIFTMRDRRDETVDRIRAIRTQNFKYIRNFYPERPYTQFNAYKKQAYPVLSQMQLLHENGELNDVQDQFMKDTRPGEELYELKTDSWEIHNLAGDKTYDNKLVQLREIMDSVLLAYDKGTYPEDQKETDFAKQMMKKRYKKLMKQRNLPENPTNKQIVDYWEKKFKELE